MPSSQFRLASGEASYLEGLRERPIVIAYSYGAVYSEQNGELCGILSPILGVLKNEFGLDVELRKLNWKDAFEQVDRGDVDFYGPVAITEAIRRKYITINPFFRSFSKIVSRVKNPINSMLGLYNLRIGLLDGSVISKTLQTYLGTSGKIIYFSTMDDMIEGLQWGIISTFATVDNAELEVMAQNDIRYEFSIENFYVDQGLIGTRETMRPLASILNRYIAENPQIYADILDARREAILCDTKERLSDEIADLQSGHDEILLYADTSSYPLCYSDGGTVKGMQLEINEIFEELTDIPVRFATNEDFPSGMKSALKKLKTGECAAIVGVYYDTDLWNDPEFEYSPRIWLDTIRTYSYEDTKRSLFGKTVGTTRFAIDYVGWNHTTGNLPVIYNSHDELLKALKKGYIDAVFMGESAFDYRYTVLKDYGLRQVTDISAEATMHAVYDAKNKSFKNVFDESLALFQILNPRAMGIWRAQSDKYKADYIRMRHAQQLWGIVTIAAFVIMFVALLCMLRRYFHEQKNTRAILKVGSAPICVVNAENGAIVDVNAAFVSLCRFGTESNVKKITLRELLVEGDGFPDRLRSEKHIDNLMMRSNGQTTEVELFARPLVFKGRNAFVVHCIDLTKQKMEKALLQRAIDEAEEKRRIIISSMEYASKIQRNLLPVDEEFKKAFSDYSVIWRPRDIVGGDIYWLENFNDGAVLCVCDCTGHGIPGALLTSLVVSAFENIIKEKNHTDTAEIMWRLDRRLSDALHVDAPYTGHSNRMNVINDGCDLAVIFASKDGSLRISSGNMQVFVCDGRKVTRIKGQRLFIGEGKLKHKSDIKTVTVRARSNQKFYIASDGLFDQIGGENELPFGYEVFKRIILENHHEKQELISARVWGAFERHRGGEAMRDDVELITFKL